jgi:hypothetical protein
MPNATEQAPKDVIGFLDFYLVKKAPFQIPEGGKEAIVKYGPWVLVVLLVLSIPAVLLLLGIGTVLLPFGGLPYAGGFGLAAVLLLVSLGLEVASLPGLFARKMSGWKLLFYARALAVLAGLASWAALSAIIGGLISFYILFQVREKYS